MERNVDLFHAVAEKIESDPKRYNQGSWGTSGRRKTPPTPACKTSHCIAGWAAVIAAPERVSWLGNGWGPGVWMMSAIDGDMQQLGADLLGLTDDEAEVLFSIDWKPREDLTVPEALVKIGNGASIAEVSPPIMKPSSQVRFVRIE